MSNIFVCTASLFLSRLHISAEFLLHSIQVQLSLQLLKHQCSILSSMANICSVFICSFGFYSQRERINFFIFPVFVEISRMYYYGFALEIRIRKESISVPGLGNSRDLVCPQFPGDNICNSKINPGI